MKKIAITLITALITTTAFAEKEVKVDAKPETKVTEKIDVKKETKEIKKEKVVNTKHSMSHDEHREVKEDVKATVTPSKEVVKPAK